MYNMKSEGSDQGSSNGFAPPSMRSNARKKAQGSHMNLEELRINKGLLREISKKKRQTTVIDLRSNTEAPQINDIADIMSN